MGCFQAKKEFLFFNRIEMPETQSPKINETKNSTPVVYTSMPKGTLEEWAMQDSNPRRRVRSPSGYPGYPNRP